MHTRRLRRRRAGLWLAVAVAALSANPARADGPGPDARAWTGRHRLVRHARRDVPPPPTVPLVPPCDDGIVLLLRCGPRVELPVQPSDTALLNEIATSGPTRYRPYRQLFSWDEMPRSP